MSIDKDRIESDIVLTMLSSGSNPLLTGAEVRAFLTSL